MSLSGICCVVHPSVLLSMLSLVEASCLGVRSCLHNVSAKVEGMYLCGYSYSQFDSFSYLSERRYLVISFCGVGIYHQSGIAERKVKDITLGGWTLLLHAKRMFLKYISTFLWPFAVKCYKDRLKNLIHCADGRTPYKTLASLNAAPINTSNFHTFCAHITFWIIGYNQVLERFPNGNPGRGWVFMLGVCLLMHSMLHWFWIRAQDMFCCNFMWCMNMTSPKCLICVHQLFLHTGQNLSALPQHLHCTLNAKLEHGNLSPSSMLNRVILHRILWMLTLHLQPLLLNIVREMMGFWRS